jgi:hypothetical protein
LRSGSREVQFTPKAEIAKGAHRVLAVTALQDVGGPRLIAASPVVGAAAVAKASQNLAAGGRMR